MLPKRARERARKRERTRVSNYFSNLSRKAMDFMQPHQAKLLFGYVHVYVCEHVYVAKAWTVVISTGRPKNLHPFIGSFVTKLNTNLAYEPLGFPRGLSNF